MKYSIIALLLLSMGCSTVLPYSVVAENTWFLEDNKPGVDPIYCWANKKPDGEYYPLCRKAAKDATVIKNKQD